MNYKTERAYQRAEEERANYTREQEHT